ncbi:CDP-alcohol phosphatidyltransferase family protein [Cellulomonas sp. PhB150]|uniref:CDP-alcohol phosphatidyltransferase family protein n=1 Tax=Cellulomonas sp. PhB150 TaxID=2485188 RepID=UPI000F49711B|nr:CDP-alcohol phosphatidyltransferase family protein [Cellulomonas sp. PhB150]ROS22972.1 CDP-alcohol phosphatidyltransferase-like enzyme [Cellulomonas sp. PhB150]
MTTTRELVRQLSAAQKPAAGVSYWSRWVNRPVGRLLAVGAIRAGVSANGVTALSATVTVIALALVCLVTPVWWLGVLVALLLVLGFALDSADGQVARFTGTGSAAGEWFDHVVDAGKMVAVHTAVLVGWFRFVDLPSTAWLLVPLAYQLVSVVVYAGGTLEPLLRRRVEGAPLKQASAARALALLPADYGVLAASFVLWGAPAVFRWGYVALGAATAVLGIALLARWFRQLR